MTKTLIFIILSLLCFGCSEKYHNISINITEQDACMPKPFIRNNYFDGQVLGVDDFQNEQSYHIGKQNLHNECLHDWGVVCGLWVIPSKEYDDKVIVTSGLALDQNGQEILVPKAISVPIGSHSGDIYITIIYKPIPTEYVPVLGEPAYVDSESKQYSRTEESFDFKMLDKLPEGYISTKDIIEKSKDGDMLEAIFRNHLTCCSKNKDMPIVLAKVKADNGKIKENDVDNISYRRLVLNSSDMAILMSGKSLKK